MSESKEHEMPSTFSQLVIMLATTALQQLGQIPDPSGKQPDISLEGAQGMIDLLEMLEAKTKGNLDEAEGKMLRESLTMLRLQFVEVKQATGGRQQSRPNTEERPHASPAEPASEPAPEKPDEDSQSKTKFRKSYG